MIRLSVAVSSIFPGVPENPDAKTLTMNGEKMMPSAVRPVRKMVIMVSIAFANSHASFFLSSAR